MADAGYMGLKDQPIESIEEEALGLGEYAEVLTEFIQKCDTPLTIALQGDWGSGKTSLMTLLKNALDKDSVEGQPYLTVWFNTWQYAQFNMSETLPLSMMSKITDALAPADGSAAIDTVKRSLWAATRAVAIGGASLVGQADTVKEVMNEAERAREPDGTEDPAAALAKIKEGLKTIVAQRVGDGTEKVVVFIDDLDRLVPAKAVELLEAMKIFLDIDHCVYVIACDYTVVVRGLKDKFGLAEGELKGKSFFDKIIQVPFKMPTRRYQVDRYIESLLGQIGVGVAAKTDIDRYRELVDHSVGFNPRTMKRLLNTLQLLTILDARRRRRESESGLTEDQETERRRHASRVTFGILCMLERYEPVYDHLTTNLNADSIVQLGKGLAEAPEYEELRKQMGEDDIDSAAAFYDAFLDCLQLDDDANLSDEEVRHLEEMLSQSALVSSGRILGEFVPREFAIELRRELNNRYSDFVRCERPKYDKFRMDRGTVWLNLPWIDSWFTIARQGGDYTFDLCTGFWEGAAEWVTHAGAYICEHSGWPPGEYCLDQWEQHCFRFYSRPAESAGSLAEFKEELFVRLDGLTQPKSRLFDLCSAIPRE